MNLTYIERGKAHVPYMTLVVKLLIDTSNCEIERNIVSQNMPKKF